MTLFQKSNLYSASSEMKKKQSLQYKVDKTSLKSRGLIVMVSDIAWKILIINVWKTIKEKDTN